jgi:hypothetical protein
MSFLQVYPGGLEDFHPGGRQELLEIAEAFRTYGVHDGTHSASREDLSGGPLALPVSMVAPAVLLEHAPWVADWYRGPLLKYARAFMGRLVVASEDPRNFPLVNVHEQGVRYEAHVDSNQPVGLELLAGDCSPQNGGALAISNRGDVPDLGALLANCVRHYPRVGEVAIMDGYRRTHAVEPLLVGERVMMVYNFWTEQAPESMRLAGLAEYDQGKRPSSQ